MDHSQLRAEICDNIKDHENCHYINELRLQMQSMGITWNQYFEEQSSPGERVKDLFITATAWQIGLNIRVNSLQSTPNNPFYV